MSQTAKVDKPALAKERRRRRFAGLIWLIIIGSLAIHVFFWVANETFLKDVRWKHVELHACVEFSGAIVAFLVAFMLISSQTRARGTSFNIWIAGALIGMGLLDGMHAAVKAGESFVWLHSMATFVGGLLFALVWLPQGWDARVARWWHWAVFVAMLIFGTLSLLWPDWFPQMVVNDRFSLWARGLNIAGGVLLLLAALRLVQFYFRKQNVDDLLFFLHCALFGSAAIMFEQSQLWDVAWWGWHLLRLLAYAVALWFVVLAERGTQVALARTSRELKTLNATLEDRVEQRTQELERRSAELAKEQYLLNSLVESIPDSVFFKDRESRFLRVNRIMAADTGFDEPGDLVGKTDSEVWSGEDFNQQSLQDEQEILATGRAIINKEENPVNKDGVSRWVLVTKMPLMDEAGEIIGTFGIARDITNRKRDEVALQRVNDELAQSNHDLEQFAYVASHDLNEPLRAVAGFTDLLKAQYGDQFDDTAKMYIEHAAEGAKRMQSLIASLLDYSRVGTRGGPIEEVDLKEAFEGAAANLSAAIAESEATIIVGDLPTVPADKSQIVRLFQNLVGNALKFRGNEPPRIEVGADQRDGQSFVFVRDNGIGIAPAYQQRVFEIFKRLHGRGDYPGTGIGLSICEKIVSRHEGQIWIESEEGEGCTFCFTLWSKGD